MWQNVISRSTTTDAADSLFNKNNNNNIMYLYYRRTRVAHSHYFPEFSLSKKLKAKPKNPTLKIRCAIENIQNE